MEARGSKVIELRQARAEDKEGILAIASATWEGWDYVPLLLDRWIVERGFYVAEHAGKIVGITKTTELSPGELWLEAIRVAETHRQKGWGLQIAEKQLQLALATNPKSIRLSTADINTASLGIIHRLGFSEYAAFRYFQQPPVTHPVTPISTSEKKKVAVEQLRQKDAAKAWKLITASEEFAASKGLLPHTWKFYQWTEERFGSLISEGSVYVTGEGCGVLILLPCRYSSQNLEIAFIEGDEDALQALEAFAGFSFAGASGEGRFAAFAASKRKRDILQRIGMKPHERITCVYVFDYPLADG